MGAKVLKTIVVAAGVLVLAVLAFVVVYMIGYALFAVFSHGGMSAGSARGVGVGIAALVAILLLVFYLRTRRSRELSERPPRRNRAA
jgi:hypothetical protein